MKKTQQIISLFIALTMLFSVSVSMEMSAYAALTSSKGKLGMEYEWGGGNETDYLWLKGVKYKTKMSESGEYTYYIKKDGKVGICAYWDWGSREKSSAKTLNLPKKIDGKKVTELAYADPDSGIGITETNYKKIVVPSTVKYISSFAIYNNKKLKEVVIPSSVKTIDDYAIGFNYSKNGKNVDGHSVKKQKDLVIHGAKGSAAQKYAKKYGFKFKKIKKSSKINASKYKVSLSKTSYTYDGEAKKPSVTVKNKKGEKINKKYYTVSYESNTNPGEAKVIVKFKGKYTGSITKTFTINPA